LTQNDRRKKNRVPALYYLDPECQECQIFKYNIDTEEWQRSENTPRKGDHVVVDGTEMVKIEHGNYRELAVYEQELWDFSLPDESQIDIVHLSDKEDGLPPDSLYTVH
jgi:hypothetical protein